MEYVYHTAQNESK